MTIEDTATESAETPESPVAETSAKPAPKKTAARKPAARKAADRKTATKKSAAKKSTGKSYMPDFSRFTLEKSTGRLKASADMAQTMVKTVVYAQMGVYGVIYDGVASRIENTRAGIPKQWQTLVKRGEKMQKDFDKSQEELKSKIKDIDLKEEAKKFSSSTKESLSKVTSFGKKAA